MEVTTCCFNFSFRDSFLHYYSHCLLWKSSFSCFRRSPGSSTPLWATFLTNNLEWSSSWPQTHCRSLPPPADSSGTHSFTLASLLSLCCCLCWHCCSPSGQSRWRMSPPCSPPSRVPHLGLSDLSGDFGRLGPCQVDSSWPCLWSCCCWIGLTWGFCTRCSPWLQIVTLWSWGSWLSSWISG